MEMKTEFIELSTRGDTDIIDITERVQSIVSQEGFREGSASVFAIGSTGGITTVEYEPGLVNSDLPRLFDTLAPYGEHYAHHNTWGDDNGSSHVRASLLGCAMTVPFIDGKLLLGTWQQIVFIDFDTRPRKRRISVQLAGIKG
ncbi:MAG: YjbQ family protein [Nitrospirota bacterium]|nr:MAG: YjbQ family protein [Nitrospirota bacterium]